jgi:hypothetical protein
MSFEFHEIIPYMTKGLNNHLFNPILRHTSLGKLLTQIQTPTTLNFLQGRLSFNISHNFVILNDSFIINIIKQICF